MNDRKEFLEHFDAGFYTGKEWVSQKQLNEYLNTVDNILHRYNQLMNPDFLINGKFNVDYLSNKDLRGLDFGRRRIPDLNIRNSILHYARLSCCTFDETDFAGSDLTGAHFYGANLSTTKLDMVKGLPAMACPEEGGFTGWKKAIYSWIDSGDNWPAIHRHNALIKLYIPARAKRSSATTNKCRASEAFVLDIVDMFTGEELDHASSTFDSGFIYRRGEWVYPEEFSFDENRWNECAPGIHFFIDKQSAIEY